MGEKDLETERDLKGIILEGKSGEENEGKWETE